MHRIFVSVIALAALMAFSNTANAQVDDICREFGIIPSLDKPWEQVPYLYGRVVLNGFDPASKPRVTVILSDRNNASNRITVSKTGNYCYRRTGSGGSLLIEVDGVEVARRTIPSFASGQHREDFDIYPDGSQHAAPPGTVSAKFSHPRNEKTVEFYQNAARAEKAKEFDKAIEQVKQIVTIDPADFIAWSILGSLHLEQKAYSDADAAFRKSLALKVEYTPAWVNVGRLRVAQGQPEAAIEIFKHAATLDPQAARTYRLLGETYLQAKQGSLAVEALNQAIKLDPIGMADCHLLLGRLYDLAGAKQYATREYKAFLAKVPDYADKKKLEKYIKANPE
ncbi:MAG TPA: tetratricopeptide repeat protein [Pyrinomonadaceae bacterium]